MIRLTMRRWGWAVAIGVALALGVGLSRLPDWADAAAGLAILAGLLGVLGVESVLLVVGQTRDVRVRPASKGPMRPADGFVEIVPVLGVEMAPDDVSATWRRFERMGMGEAVSSVLPDANPRLLGQVVLMSVFVGRDGRGWTAREIEEAHRSLQAVALWVEREAIARGAPANVGLADTYFAAMDDHDEVVELDFVPEGDDFGPMEARATTKSVASASRVAAALGFGDVADLLDRINRRVEADAHVWLFHLRQRGRSHAVPVGDRVVRGVGLAFCYARESSFPEPLKGAGRVDPTTVAHELLHLFGASDKYGVPLADFPPGTVPRRDIMRLEEDRLGRLTIGRQTAAEIGWPAVER